jgi:hypothetical protein
MWEKGVLFVAFNLPFHPLSPSDNSLLLPHERENSFFNAIKVLWKP